MDTARGLLVPNIKNVQDRSIIEIARELARLTALGAEVGPPGIRLRLLRLLDGWPVVCTVECSLCVPAAAGVDLFATSPDLVLPVLTSFLGVRRASSARRI